MVGLQQKKFLTTITKKANTLVKLSSDELSGPHKLLTQREIHKIEKAKAGGKGMILRLNATQLKKHQQGGFLGMLAATNR